MKFWNRHKTYSACVYVFCGQSYWKLLNITFKVTYKKNLLAFYFKSVLHNLLVFTYLTLIHVKIV